MPEPRDGEYGAVFSHKLRTVVSLSLSNMCFRHKLASFPYTVPVKVCIYDVRSGTSPVQRLAVHQGLGRESRVLFCGDRLLSSGFTSVSSFAKVSLLIHGVAFFEYCFFYNGKQQFVCSLYCWKGKLILCSKTD